MANRLFATKKLKEMRLAAGMTQEEFAGLMAVWLDDPVSLSTVQKWEQGQRPMNPKILLEVAKYFKVEPRVLAERKE